MKWWDQMPWSSFFECWVLSPFSLSSFTFIKRLFSSSSLSAIRVVSPAHLRILLFLPAILIPTCASSSPAFRKMYSAYRLNKQRDNIQPWHTPFILHYSLCVDHNKWWKFWWEYQTTLPASWEICMQVKKQQLELDMEQPTGSKSGKEYVKAVYCHLLI